MVKKQKEPQLHQMLILTSLSYIEKLMMRHWFVFKLNIDVQSAISLVKYIIHLTCIYQLYLGDM